VLVSVAGLPGGAGEEHGNASEYTPAYTKEKDARSEGRFDGGPALRSLFENLRKEIMTKRFRGQMHQALWFSAAVFRTTRGDSISCIRADAVTKAAGSAS
jgi:hypothetical protein